MEKKSLTRCQILYVENQWFQMEVYDYMVNCKLHLWYIVIRNLKMVNRKHDRNIRKMKSYLVCLVIIVTGNLCQ